MENLTQPPPKRNGKKIMKPRAILNNDQIEEIKDIYVKQGKTVAETARRMHVTHGVMRDTLLELKILRLPVGTPALKEKEENEMLDLYKEGWSISSLAERFSCSYDTIKVATIKAGMFLRRYNKIEFTKEQENQILSQYKNGDSLSKISKVFNCTVTPIERVLRENGTITRGVEWNGGKNRFINKDKKNHFTVAVYNNRMHSAIKQGLEWKITQKDINEIYEKQSGLCFYTGIPLRSTDNPKIYASEMKNNPLTISIDRRDSSVGYSIDNIVLCCRFVNYAKNAYSEDVFMQSLRLLVENLSAKVASGQPLWDAPKPRSIH